MASVDLAGEFDEARVEIELLRFPGEVERVDGDAVAAEAGAGIEGLEAEGLGFGGVDDFKQVDAHAHAKLLQFVDQGDVDAAVDVFKQLGHLRRGRRRDRNGAVEDGRVDGGGQFESYWSATAHDFWNVAAGDRIVAGIFALGRESDVESGAFGVSRHAKAGGISLLQQRNNNFLGGAGIGGALQDNELALLEVGGDGCLPCR